MEQVALAWLVNDGIRTLAEQLDVPAESHVYAWVCACGCFTMVTATLAEYDASAGQVFAAGHPSDAERQQRPQRSSVSLTLLPWSLGSMSRNGAR